MNRYHLGSLLLVLCACGSAIQHGDDTQTRSAAPSAAPAGPGKAFAASRKLKQFDTATTAADACTANTISWTVDSPESAGACSADPNQTLTPAQSFCAGGFKYTPYASPCYNSCCGDSVAQGSQCPAGRDCSACSSPTNPTYPCNGPANCRDSTFGVAQSLPDFTTTLPWGSVCIGTPYTALESTCVNYSLPQAKIQNLFVNNPGILSYEGSGIGAGNATNNWGIQAQQYSNVLVRPICDLNRNSSTYNELQCQFTFEGVSQFRTFQQWDATQGNKYVVGDPAHNPCPADLNEVEACPNPSGALVYPNCRSSAFGSDSTPGACGDATTPAYDTPNPPETLETFRTAHANAYDTSTESCISTEDLPVGTPQDPTNLPRPLLTSSPVLSGSSTAADCGLAQAKYNSIQTALGIIAANEQQGNNVGPYNPNLQNTLTAESELLFELEGEFLTTDQQEQIWQMYLSSDAREPCEASWTPVAPAGTDRDSDGDIGGDSDSDGDGEGPSLVCTTSPAPPPDAPARVNWGQYMTRALNACSALGSQHASVGAATQFAARCLALARAIPWGVGSEPLPGCGIGHCPTESCTYQPYRDEWRTMALSLLQKILQGVVITPAASTSVLSADPEVQSYLAFLNQWYWMATGVSPDAKTLAGDMDYVAGLFWQAVQAAPTATAGAGAKANDPKAAQVFVNQTIANNLQVLEAIASPISAATPLLPWAPGGSANATVAGAATTGSVPLNSPPLLLLLGNILQTVSGRLEYASEFHDLGCRFQGCIGVQTNVSQMWQALSLLATPASANPNPLTTALANSDQLFPQWKEALTTLAQNHASTIETAARVAFDSYPYNSAWLTAGNTANLPPVTMGLSQVIQSAAAHTASYAATGMLGTTAVSSSQTAGQAADSSNTLNMGLQASTLGTNDNPGSNTMIGNLEPLLTQLSSYIGSYDQNVPTDMSGILGQQGAATKAADLASQAQGIVAQATFLEGEVAGLQASDAANTLSLGQQFNIANFTSAFNFASSSAAVNPTTDVLLATLSTTIPPGPNALGSSGWSDITQIAIMSGGTGGWPAHAAGSAAKPLPPAPGTTSTTLNANGGPLPSGYLLNIATTGKWTPTCALQTAQIPDPNDTSQPLSMSATADSYTGPEGYYLSISGNNATANSNSSTNTQTNNAGLSASVKVCMGVRTTAGAAMMGNGVEAYADISACAGYEAGMSWSAATAATNLNTSASQTTANFSSGLRLPNTPFPNLPAGALLLVEMSPMQTGPGAILDVQVVQSPSMTVLINQPADVYLVENDSPDPRCSYDALGGRALNVTVNELEPQGAIFPSVAKAMVKALTYVQGAAPSLVSEGQILPGEMDSLRATANTILDGNLPAALNGNLPSAFNALYAQWLESELTHVQRVAQEQYDNYQVSLLAIQAAQIAQDEVANGETGLYNQLLSTWALANMNVDQNIGIQSSLTQILQIVTEQLYPAAAVRYPIAMNNITANLMPQLEALTSGLDWTKIDVTNAKAANELVAAIVSQFKTGVTATGNQGQLPVALEFPNPAYPNTVPGNTLTGLQADPVRSAAVWNAINASNDPNAAPSATQVAIAIQPEDIYRLTGGNINDLLCTYASPVIDNMALYVSVYPGDTATLNLNPLNSSGISGPPTVPMFPITVSDEMGFATQAGLQAYQFNNPVWLNSKGVGIISGQESGEEPALQGFLNQNVSAPFLAGAGLSPFTTFTIDFAGLGPMMKAAGMQPPMAISLVWMLEATPPGVNGGALTWPKTCH